MKDIPKEEPIKSVPKQEVVTCQIIISNTNRVFIKNNTKETLIVLLKSTLYFLNTELKLIKPKVESEIAIFQTKENSIVSNTELTFEIYTKKMKKLTNKYKILRRDEYIINDKTNERKYFYDILY